MGKSGLKTSQAGNTLLPASLASRGGLFEYKAEAASSYQNQNNNSMSMMTAEIPKSPHDAAYASAPALSTQADTDTAAPTATSLSNANGMTSKDYYFDSYAHFGMFRYSACSLPIYIYMYIYIYIYDLMWHNLSGPHCTRLSRACLCAPGCTEALSLSCIWPINSCAMQSLLPVQTTKTYAFI